MYQLYLLARHWRWLSESTFLNDLVWSSALFLRNPVSYTELFWSQFDCFLSDLRDEVHAVYSNILNKSDLLLNEELGTCLSDSVPWGRPLNESIYVSYGQDDPELCRRFGCDDDLVVSSTAPRSLCQVSLCNPLSLRYAVGPAETWSHVSSSCL